MSFPSDYATISIHPNREPGRPTSDALNKGNKIPLLLVNRIKISLQYLTDLFSFRSVEPLQKKLVMRRDIPLSYAFRSLLLWGGSSVVP